MVSLGRPGYRIDNRTIKRGSQVSNLTVSFERAQTFAYLASYLSWFLFGFYPCEDLVLVLISMTSSSSSKTDSEWISYCVFDIGGFTGSSFLERSNLSPFGFNLPYWTMMFPCSRACGYLRNKPKFIKNRFQMYTPLCFWCWRIYRFFVQGGFTPFSIPYFLPCWSSIFPLFVGNYTSLYFQQNWFHLIWSSDA